MCKGKDCPIRDSCYRFTAKPSEGLQTWLVESYFENDECPMKMDACNLVSKTWRERLKEREKLNDMERNK